MKFGVVVFPGSNCDKDMIYVLETLYKQEVVSLWHKDTELQNCDFIILPGGFSYGDYLRSGAIARFSPIMEKVIEFANNGGYVMGVVMAFKFFVSRDYCPGYYCITTVTNSFVKTFIYRHKPIAAVSLTGSILMNP